MEPCAHHGTTPPCVDAVLAAGSRVSWSGRSTRTPRHGAGSSGSVERRRRGRKRLDELRGARPERGVANLGRARPAVRHLQGGDDGRRAGHRAGRALGLRGGSRRSGPRAARRVRRGRRGMGTVRLETRASTRATSTSRASRGGWPSAAVLCPTARSSSFAPARSRTSCALWPPRASSRCCSKGPDAGPGLPGSGPGRQLLPLRRPVISAPDRSSSIRSVSRSG